ncbi:MAG TPA: hypothetical protein VMT79_08215, partial [Candidatus Binatia bacterium]|nr:hypothetical protein [Candidatus Binatia bacterium]
QEEVGAAGVEAAEAALKDTQLLQRTQIELAETYVNDFNRVTAGGGEVDVVGGGICFRRDGAVSGAVRRGIADHGIFGP